MKSFSELKTTAKMNLKGHWVHAIVIFILQGLILNGASFMKQVTSGASSSRFFEELTRFVMSGGAGPMPNAGGFFFANSILSFISFTVNLLLGGVLAYGLSVFFLHISRKQPANINDLFEGTSKFASCFVAYLLVSIFSILWSIPTIGVLVIAAVVLGVVIGVSGSQSLATILIILIVIVSIAICLLLSAILARYAFVYYLIKDSQQTDALNYVKQSKAMMKGRAWTYVLLNLSFVNWAILCIFTCGIGFLALSPWIQATLTEFYLDALEETKSRGPLEFVTLTEEPIIEASNGKQLKKLKFYTKKTPYGLY